VNIKKLTVVAALALAASMLAACAPNMYPSYVALGYESRASAEGTVRLQDVTDIPNTFGASPLLRTPAGNNTTARIEATANFIDGSWQIHGSWRDGFVKFNFKGWALGSLTSQIVEEVCGSDVLSCIGKSRPAPAEPTDSGHGHVWVNGGCSIFYTYYTSANSIYPGTGIAEITLCDKGPGGNLIAGSWPTEPDSVAVSVLDTRTGLIHDASPFVGYASSGTMSNSKVSVRTRYTGVAPTTTAPAIDFTTASPSSS